MSHATINGIRLHFVETGEGSGTVVFSHGYLFDHRHFEAQIEGLSDRYRVLAYDHRDHGGSDRVPGPYGMQDIYRDGVGFLEVVAETPSHWVGLSTGGFVGLRIAIRRPELLRSLVVVDSAADLEPRLSLLKYRAMLAVVDLVGFRPVLGQAMKAMFGPEFLRNPQQRGPRELWKRRLQANDRDASVRFGRAIFARRSVESRLSEIRVPTLVLSGEDDRAVAPARARRTAEAIPGARFETIPGAGHLSTIERPSLVAERIRSFVDSIG